MTRRERMGLLAATLALFAAAASMVRYGLDLSDEGYIVYPAAQVASGLVPYRDINTLYTPLAWYLHAALFKIVGVELIPLRLLFSAVAVLLAAGVYLVARRFVTWPFAAVAMATFALVFPIPRTWAPYPAWYAMLGLLIGLLAVLQWIDDRRDRWLVATGIACALAFGTKPNLGLFGLMAFFGFFLLQARALARSSDPARGQDHTLLPGAALSGLQAGYVLACLAAFWLLVRGVATPGNQVLLLSSLALAGLATTERPSGPVEAHVVWEVVRRGAVVAIAFVLATLPWYVAVSSAAGWGLTFDTIFRSGARNAYAVYGAILLPNRDAWEALAWILAGALAAAALGFAARRGWLRRRLLLTGLAAVPVVGAGAVAWRARAAGIDVVQYLRTNLDTRLQRGSIEETEFITYLPFLAVWGVALLVLWRGRRSAAPAPRQRLLVWFAAVSLFQYYPRASSLHVAFLIAPFLVLAEVLRAAAWERIARLIRQPVWRTVAALLLLVFPLFTLPSAVRARADRLRDETLIDLPHAGVFTSTANATQLRLVSERLAALPPGANVFAYPAMPMVYLLTDNQNPTRESYLPSGYLDEAATRAVAERLEQAKPRYVVWDQELVDRWGLRPSDRPLVDYIWSTYQPIAVERAWVLLERREAAPPG